MKLIWVVLQILNHNLDYLVGTGLVRNTWMLRLSRMAFLFSIKLLPS